MGKGSYLGDYKNHAKPVLHRSLYISLCHWCLNADRFNAMMPCALLLAKRRGPSPILPQTHLLGRYPKRHHHMRVLGGPYGPSSPPRPTGGAPMPPCLGSPHTPPLKPPAPDGALHTPLGGIPAKAGFGMRRRCPRPTAEVPKPSPPP